MSTIRRLTVYALLFVAAVIGLNGCDGSGGTTNNDQGRSFLAFGYFSPEGTTPCEIGLAGVIQPLFFDSAAQGALGNADGNLVIAEIGLQNRLSSQFIRLVRIDCSYEVPGSSLAVPDNVAAFSTVIGPTEDAGQAPDAEGLIGNVSCSRFPIVSTDIFAFLNNNNASLPQLPFTMTATCSATGVTEAGDVLTTNPLSLLVQMVDLEEGVAGANTQFILGPASGGTLNSFSTGNETDAATIDGEALLLDDDSGDELPSAFNDSGGVTVPTAADDGGITDFTDSELVIE